MSSTAVLKGADHAFSKVAQNGGYPAQQTAHFMQALVGLPRGISPHTTGAWFIHEETPYFFRSIPPFTDTRRTRAYRRRRAGYTAGSHEFLGEKGARVH